MALTLRRLALGGAFVAGCGGGGGGGGADAGADAGPDGGEPWRLDCWDGWVGDGEGGCEPVLPEGDCQVGTMPVIGEAGCQPVGPPAECWDGFVNDGAGGCEPILPPREADCPDGTMEVIGEAECQPVGDCDAAIEADPDAVFVAAGESIQDALSAAPVGGQVIVAPGEYVGDVSVNKVVRVHGQCAALVTIVGTGDERAVRIYGGSASGVELRGVTVTGPAVGIEVRQRAGVTIEDVVVAETGSFGIFAWGGAEVTVRGVLVAAARDAGILAVGATLAAEASVVRDTRATAAGGFGRGIDVEFESDLTVRRTLVAGNREMGVLVFGSTATVEESAVLDTLAREADDLVGWGIGIQDDPVTGAKSEVSVRRTIVAGNRDVGVFVAGSAATVEESVVKDTLARADDGLVGRGIYIQYSPDTGAMSDVFLRRTLVAGNRDVGVLVSGSTATVEESAVLDTLAREADGLGGWGIGIQGLLDTGAMSEVSFRRTLVAGNREAGVFVSGSTTRVEESAIRDTLPQEADGLLGRGIHIQDSPTTGAMSQATLRRTLVAGNRDSGVFVAGSTATVEESAVLNTLALEAKGLFGWGIAIAHHPATGATSQVSVRRTLVAGSREMGVLVAGATATVEESVISDTLAEEATGEFGDGVAVAGSFPGEGTVPPTSAMLGRVVIRRSARAGVYFYDAGGSLAGSVVRDCRFAVALEGGANPAIGKDNLFEECDRNEVTVGQNLEPPPPLESLDL